MNQQNEYRPTSLSHAELAYLGGIVAYPNENSTVEYPAGWSLAERPFGTHERITSLLAPSCEFRKRVSYA